MRTFSALVGYAGRQRISEDFGQSLLGDARELEVCTVEFSGSFGGRSRSHLSQEVDGADRGSAEALQDARDQVLRRVASNRAASLLGLDVCFSCTPRSAGSAA